MSTVDTGTFIDEARIQEALSAAADKDAGHVREILAKARELSGLEMEDVAVLSSVSDPDLLGELFATARDVKEAIYGARLVLFAPLYVSNMCANDCLYCAFRVRNKELKRRALTQDEIREEVEILIDQGHKRVLLVAGESYPDQGFQYVLDSVATIYDVKRGNGEIRRVNVNVAPLTLDEFRALKATGIGTYQLFQETYHRATYKAVHVGGKKRDYDWRVTAMHRAMEAGVDDVGIGVLLASTTGASSCSPSCSTSGSSNAPSASALTRSACLASSPPSDPTSRATRPSPSATSTSARSSPSCASPSRTPG